jgi:hypothetical protein
VRIVPWHQVGSAEGLAEFVDSFVHGSSRLANVHEEVFADGFYPVEAGLTGDLPEFFFCCGERDPWGPREGGPGVGEEVPVFWISMRWVGIGRHLRSGIGWRIG